MARYARSHRAVKIHTAEQHGAAAIIIYSDPADDGYAKGLTWPEGPWRADFSRRAAMENIAGSGMAILCRLAWARAPMCWNPLLRLRCRAFPPWFCLTKKPRKSCRNFAAPRFRLAFKERLPFTYRLGPGPAVVKLDVQMDAELPDYPRYRRAAARKESGALGGARNPSRCLDLRRHGSGQRNIGGVTKPRVRWRRWRNRAGCRTAPSCSPSGMPKSLGWLVPPSMPRHSKRELRQKAVAYINTDLFMQRAFFGGGTPSLRDFLVQVTKDVPALSGKGSVYDEWRADAGRSSPERAAEGQKFRSGTGGSRQRRRFRGLPGLSWACRHYRCSMILRAATALIIPTTTRDITWSISAILVSTWRGRSRKSSASTVMRLADAAVLPYRYSHYAQKISEFLETRRTWGG